MSEVKTITKEELQKKLGSVQLVNVLDPKWYELGIIQGSKQIPLAELATRLGELNKAQEVVTYCASAQCTASSEAATLLAAKGFTVSAYEGGVKEWKAAGLPMEAPKARAKATAKTCSCC